MGASLTSALSPLPYAQTSTTSSSLEAFRWAGIITMLQHLGVVRLLQVTLLSLICLASIAYSVRPADFKKCNDSSFCRRIRRLSKYVEAESTPSHPFKSPYYIASGSSAFEDSDSTLTASIKSALHPEIDFELKVHFYQDGTSRLKMDQVGHRYGGWKRYDGAASWAFDKLPVPAAKESLQVDIGEHETVVQ
jgi:alpha 1,3-glucosidase